MSDQGNDHGRAEPDVTALQAAEQAARVQMTSAAAQSEGKYTEAVAEALRNLSARQADLMGAAWTRAVNHPPERDEPEAGG
jgi:hypothetical protein